ncbi:MAG: hypothetical protein II466_02330 [Bacteroidales bacterium]|jgi:hypothetical protein|nr:hypothetical protein [Bacteroidales bacterium]MBQ8462119.1 hypothetical protein [Bacteroidales bacterium]MCR5363359.1 hypothetical protein [Bacteroidales bacterium]MDT3361748.1 hypothetical protein [Bacteroidota bacterium]
MNETLKKVLQYCILPLVIVALVIVIVKGVQKPVKFDKEKEFRTKEAVQRLKDIRDLQVAYKSVNGKFSSTIDSLILFYNTGKMDVVLQVGSKDDSIAVVNTERIKKANKKITQEELYELYKKGERVIATVKTQFAVKDTLFVNRTNFVVDSIKYIPYSGGQLVEMESIVKKVSGVDVPLFEARMPYRALLKGMDNQLRINLDDERKTMNQYEGLMVGSINNPNNNAGNWE